MVTFNAAVTCVYANGHIFTVVECTIGISAQIHRRKVPSFFETVTFSCFYQLNFYLHLPRALCHSYRGVNAAVLKPFLIYKRLKKSFAAGDFCDYPRRSRMVILKCALNIKK